MTGFGMLIELMIVPCAGRVSEAKCFGFSRLVG